MMRTARDTFEIAESGAMGPFHRGGGRACRSSCYGGKGMPRRVGSLTGIGDGLPLAQARMTCELRLKLSPCGIRLHPDLDVGIACFAAEAVGRAHCAAGAQHGPGVVDDLCWQFWPAEPPGDAVCADHGVAGYAAGPDGQHGRGAAVEVAQRAAEHRVACSYPGGVDVQADRTG